MRSIAPRSSPDKSEVERVGPWCGVLAWCGLLLAALCWSPVAWCRLTENGSLRVFCNLLQAYVWILSYTGTVVLSILCKYDTSSL